MNEFRDAAVGDYTKEGDKDYESYSLGQINMEVPICVRVRVGVRVRMRF